MFPILEKIVEWVKEQGSWVYWVWVIVVGIIGALFLTIWLTLSFSDAWILLVILIVWWVGGGLAVAHYEARKERPW